MDRETLKKKSYKDLRLFISKTNITGYTKLSKREMIDLIMLQHPYRFTKCMKAVQPDYIFDLFAIIIVFAVVNIRCGHWIIDASYRQATTTEYW